MVLMNDEHFSEWIQVWRGKWTEKHQYFFHRFQLKISNWGIDWPSFQSPVLSIFNQIPHVLIFMLRLRTLSLVDTSVNYFGAFCIFSFELKNLFCHIVVQFPGYWHDYSDSLLLVRVRVSSISSFLKVKRHCNYFIIVTKHQLTH